MRACVEACGELKVEFLTLYAFSAENWQRPKTEVFALMRLARAFLEGENAGVARKECPAPGDRASHRPAGELPETTARFDRTHGGRIPGLTLILALSYGGRLEIIDGIKSLLRQIDSGHIDRAMIDVDMFSKHLYTRYYPDPDLLVRTSGEMRLSNFLLWQLSYTEMYVTPKLWPDFTKKDLFDAVEDFGQRNRRYGAV